VPGAAAQRRRQVFQPADAGHLRDGKSDVKCCLPGGLHKTLLPCVHKTQQLCRCLILVGACQLGRAILWRWRGLTPWQWRTRTRACVNGATQIAWLHAPPPGDVCGRRLVHPLLLHVRAPSLAAPPLRCALTQALQDPWRHLHGSGGTSSDSRQLPGQRLRSAAVIAFSDDGPAGCAFVQSLWLRSLLERPAWANISQVGSVFLDRSP